jgi:hypothetical protein
MRKTNVTSKEASILWNFVTDVSINTINDELTDEEFKLATKEFKEKLNALIKAKIYAALYDYQCRTD